MNHKVQRISWSLLIAAAMACGDLAWAQTLEPSAVALSSTATAEEKPDSPASKNTLGPLTVSGNWRLRGEGWNWFEGSTGDNDYGFGHSLLRVAISQQSEAFGWRLEFAQDAIFALPRSSVVPTPQGQLGVGGTYFAANGNGTPNFNGFVREALLQFKKLGKGNLQLGRFEYQDGVALIPKDATLASLVRTRIAQRLIGPSGWTAVGRTFDGGQFSYDFGKTRLSVMGARPTRGVYQVDAMGELDIGVFSGSLTIPFGHARLPGEVRVFSMGYIDERTSILKTDNRPQAVRAADHGAISIGTYGFDYLQVFNTAASGKFDLLLWQAVQTGTWGLQPHLASAFIGELGWQPPVKHLKPWISAGYSYGSGDGNSQDGHHGTFFQLLPTARPYDRFPFYNMMNSEDFYGTLNLSPHPKLSLRSELHALRLASAADLWYLGTGAFQPRTFGYTGRPSNGASSLATTADVSADYQVTKHFGANFYYAYAWGKNVIVKIYPRGANGQLAYVETNVRF